MLGVLLWVSTPVPCLVTGGQQQQGRHRQGGDPGQPGGSGGVVPGPQAAAAAAGGEPGADLGAQVPPGQMTWDAAMQAIGCHEHYTTRLLSWFMPIGLEILECTAVHSKASARHFSACVDVPIIQSCTSNVHAQSLLLAASKNNGGSKHFHAATSYCCSLPAVPSLTPLFSVTAILHALIPATMPLLRPSDIRFRVAPTP